MNLILLEQEESEKKDKSVAKNAVGGAFLGAIVGRTAGIVWRSKSKIYQDAKNKMIDSYFDQMGRVADAFLKSAETNDKIAALKDAAKARKWETAAISNFKKVHGQIRHGRALG